MVENVGSPCGGDDVGSVGRSADRAVCLQVAAAACRHQAEILGGDPELQVERAIDPAVERQARAAEDHANLLERPGIPRVRQLAAAARRDAPQPPAEPVDTYAERVIRLEAAAGDGQPEVETA